MLKFILILFFSLFFLTLGVIAVASKSENNCSQADIFRTKFTNQTLSDQLLVLLNESCVGKNQVAQLCICLPFKPSQWERIDCDFSFFLPWEMRTWNRWIFLIFVAQSSKLQRATTWNIEESFFDESFGQGIPVIK